MKVLLDTNLWSYIGDQNAGEALAQCLARLNHRLLLAPCVLVEVLKTPLADVRDRVLSEMVEARGERLRTEADLEGEEIVGEVRRFHPEWLRQVPNRPLVTRYRQFWVWDVWRSARKGAGAAAEHLERTIVSEINLMVAVQRGNQTGVRARYPRLPDRFLTQVARPPEGAQEALPGWVHPADLWRVNTALRFDRSLRRLPAAYAPSTDADWIGAFVDLKRMYADRVRTTEFFLEEIELDRAVRNWLHNYAIEAVQLFMKVTSGNPMDQQLAAHLLDCDVLVTADRRFHNVVVALREQWAAGIAPTASAVSIAPTALAVGADVNVVESIERALSQASGQLGQSPYSARSSKCDARG